MPGAKCDAGVIRRLVKLIDPIHALAFSVQGNRGVYALLLGSGVSRASGIPTGWDITLDLIQKLAALHGDDPGSAPESWYSEKYRKEPDYSDLLDQLTRTQAERQQLLREYFEPDEQERAEGRKQPTEAHHAIAALAAQGYIRVILTTNFDHLIENALREAGVEPTVLSSPDQVHGALPLIHTQCSVIKLHGDYLDTRIRNTASELRTYPPEFDGLLDQVFDEFGLIVCGWSAEWDEALRNGIYRCPSRRFATYWAARGQPGTEAKRLIGHRGADVMSIEGADKFFHAIWEYVEAVEEFSRPHPLSTKAAVAAMKRYMSEPRYRIQLADLVDDTVRKVVELTSGEGFGTHAPSVSGESFAARIQGYDAACSTLLAMAPVAGFWAERDLYPILERAFVRLATTEERSGNTVWLSFKRYPALILLFGLGIGSVEAGRLDLLGRLFSVPIQEENRQSVPAVLSLGFRCLPGDAESVAKSLPGLDRAQFPMSQWIYGVIRECCKDLTPSETQFTSAFTKLEILLALGFMHHGARLYGNWAPLGRYFVLNEERNRVLEEMRESIAAMGDDSPFVEARIFGDTADACNNGINNFVLFLGQIPRFR